MQVHKYLKKNMFANLKRFLFFFVESNGAWISTPLDGVLAVNVGVLGVGVGVLESMSGVHS